MLSRLLKRRTKKPPPILAVPPANAAPASGKALVSSQVGVPIDRVNLPQVVHNRLDLRNRRFDDLNGKGRTFVDCDFSYSVFDRAYLHGAKFEGCRFVGCRFYDSNLREASFRVCDFKYATFHRTLLEPREMLAVLPLEPNLRRDSLQNLRANAAEIGDFGSQRIFVLAEIAAAADHLSRAMKGSEDYYRRKYPTLLDKGRAAAGLARLKIGGLVWGHGEKPLRMLASATILIFLLALVNLWSVVPRVGWQETRAGIDVLKYAIDMFLDVNPVTNFRGFGLVDYALVAMRYVYIGLFISVLFKSTSHR